MNSFQQALLFAALVAFIVLAIIRFGPLDAALLIIGVYLLMPPLPDGGKR